MKRATMAKIFSVTVAAALVLGIGPKALSKANKISDFGRMAALGVRFTPTAQADDKVCSDATLRGGFAFTSTGFITTPPALAGPFAIVGRQTFDGNGSFTAAATVSQNGNIIPVTVEGTYTVNPNCTGTFTAHISPVDITTHLFFVIDDEGKEFQVIQTDPGVVVTGIARRQ
ncbi:MAG TPA: hypothetical protein VJN92_13445 [Candidatus Acidoferrum sp.]|nr:hypothetical protein [Candidatus Acidoferrum sp.]